MTKWKGIPCECTEIFSYKFFQNNRENPFSGQNPNMIFTERSIFQSIVWKKCGISNQWWLGKDNHINNCAILTAVNSVKEKYRLVWNVLNKMWVLVSFITQNKFQIQQCFKVKTKIT